MVATRNFIIFLVFQSLFVAHAEDHDPYAKIRVRVSDKSTIVRLHELGVEVERAGKPGKDGIHCIARGKILERLRAEGISFEVMVADLEKFYAERLTPGPVNALGFGYGSMGGYYMLDEIRQQLDSMRAAHPSVVGSRDSIGASLQGRPIWAVRITENPGVPSQKPQVLYFAMQHAREPMGMMTLLYFMWYVAEQYGRDPEVTYLLQNRDLWFIPIVNVDGYEANRRINHNGGGMRRKNMRNVSLDNDDYGVDLNRNWGAHWGYDDIGSDSNPLWISYRGTGPFSEPECQAMRDFSKGKAFRFVMEYHSYWNTTSCPLGYIAAETADSLLFRAYIRELTHDNHYANGFTTVTYPINGGANDWFYENPPSLGATFPFLIEVGTEADGFWPATARILPIATENLKANLFAAWAGGAYAKLQTATVLDSSGDGDLLPGERFTLQLRMRNLGQDPTTTTSISANSSSLQFGISSGAIGSLSPHLDTTITLVGRVPAGAMQGAPASIDVTVKPGGQVEQHNTVACIVGPANVIFADDAEDEPSKWYFAGGWGKTHVVSHAGQCSFTEGPGGNYGNNARSSMTLSSSVHIPEAAGIVQLRFWTRWSIEAGLDYGQVWVSTNAGSSWFDVHGALATVDQVFGYTGWQPEWAEEHIDLSNLAGRDILLRFAFTSDPWGNCDGWYVDDITIRSFSLSGLAFAHDVRLSHPAKDSLRITARVENPLAHTLNIVGTLTSASGALLDSVLLKDDGLHGDSLSADGLWGYQYVPRKDDTIRVSIRTDDITAGTSRTLQDIAQIGFTRKAVIAMDTRWIDLGRISVATSHYDTTFLVRNIGYAADSLMVYLDPGNVTPDTAVSAFPKMFRLAPGDSQKVTFSIRPGLLSTGYYAAQVIVESKFAFGQTEFPKYYQFQVVISSISDIAGLPTVFALDQNYPNPFNPSTTIRYGLPNRSHVTLTVFNTLGQQITVLQSGDREAGYHEVRFDGTGLSSGVYFYRIQAGEFVQTRRLVLLK